VDKLTEENNIKKEKTVEEINIEHLEKTEFQKIIEYSVKSGGVHMVGSKAHGKSRLMFSMARELSKLGRLYIFDGSETWLYGYDKIPVFTVQDREIKLLGLNTSTMDVERYKILNWNMVQLALNRFPVLLFRLKTRKPSKRGFFVRQVVNYLDDLQRQTREKTTDHEAKTPISYIIEEAQDCFNSKATTRLEAEEFLTVFNEARNQREAFFTASQRLTDFSKTIRTKQVYCLGRIGNEDITSGIRRIEKQHNINLCRMPQRTWFLEGLEKTFLSPDWKQCGKPYKVSIDLYPNWTQNIDSTNKQKPIGFFSRLIRNFVKPKNFEVVITGIETTETVETEQEKEDKLQEEEDEETEDLLTFGDEE